MSDALLGPPSSRRPVGDVGSPLDAFDALGLDEAVRAPLAQWIDLLTEWNKRIDLTAARTPGELGDLMLADAALLAKHIRPSARVIDVGAGAGAPGLALAIMRPDLEVTLVEPIAKRTSFLRTVIGTLRRLDVSILRERGETVAARLPRAFDIAISRATLAPPEWIPLALKLAPAGWALLARDSPPDVPMARVDENIEYEWPQTGAQRRAVRYYAL